MPAQRTLLSLAVLLSWTAMPGAARKFYSDDPLEREPAARDASKAIRRKISDYYDFFQMIFATPGERQPKQGAPIAAAAVSTLGEPMEGAWYTRRHYYRPMSTAELLRGPGNESPPSTEGKWKVVKAKSEGITPGFEFLDVKGRRYVLKFDPVRYSEISTGPDVFVSKFFHALGYHVPENYIVSFTRDQLVLGEDVDLVDSQGRPRKMTERDVTELLMRVPHTGGRYRGGASLFLAGKPLGPFKFYGTRKDDPNDTVAHEHRRDLRGLRLFCAWFDHDDSRAINTQDMLVTESNVAYIRHHLLDFGSTIGSASTGPDSPRANYAYIFEWTPAIRQFFTFGLLVPRWARAHYPDDPAVGLDESKVFDPERWVPEYPNPAFLNMLPDDGFWAAKQVMAFSNEQIRAIVGAGQYSRAASAEWIAGSLIERRDKIGRTYLAKVLPLDRFSVREGRLVFDDLEVLHNFKTGRDYQVRWSVFNNDAETKSPIAGAASFQIPLDRVPDGGYLAADIAGEDAKKTVTVYLRRRGASVQVAGIDRGW